jgi:Ca2+-transporting ATPase
MTLEISTGLRIDESALSGESVPVDRSADDEEPAVFMGTLIVGGRGEGCVTATGHDHALRPDRGTDRSAGEKTTRLQAQLRGISAAARALGPGRGGRGLRAWPPGRSGVVRHGPDLRLAGRGGGAGGLPLVVTLTLAIGASAMVRQKALLRRLQAAETLGSASVICTDKTGTLTENKMTATRVLPGARLRGDRDGLRPGGAHPAGRAARAGRARTRRSCAASARGAGVQPRPAGPARGLGDDRRSDRRRAGHAGLQGLDPASGPERPDRRGAVFQRAQTHGHGGAARRAGRARRSS